MWARNEPGNGRYNSNKAQQLICRSPAEIKLKMFNFKSAAGYNTPKIWKELRSKKFVSCHKWWLNMSGQLMDTPEQWE